MKKSNSILRNRFIGISTILFCIAIISWTLTSCSGGGGGQSGGGGNPPVANTSDATLAAEKNAYNQSPTYKSAFTTNSSPVAISGIGSGPIDTIAWENVTTSTSGSGTGTTSWSVSVPLREGDNEIQVTASTTNFPVGGTVNPKGLSTQYYFEYGPTTSYGSITSKTNVGSGSSELAANAVLTGLKGNTTYHYRLVATNSNGTSYGADKTFSLKDTQVSLSVTYNTSVTFTSLPQLTPDTGIAGDTYGTIYARIGISPANLDPTSIKLHQVDDSGGKGDELKLLTDDGNLNNGDEIQGDGIYSAKISLTSSEAKEIKMRIFAKDTTGKESKSSIFSFKFLAKVAAGDLAKQSSNLDAAISKFNNLLAKEMIKKEVTKEIATATVLDDMVSYLKGLDGVLEAGKGGYGVWWLNKTGIFGALSSVALDPKAENYRNAGDREGPAKRAGNADIWKFSTYDSRSTRIEYLRTGTGPKKGAIFAEVEGEDKYNIGSFNAIHIMPFKNTVPWYTTSYPGGWYNVVVPSVCPAFNKTDKVNNSTDPMTDAPTEPVPLSVWKSLSTYGLICSATHGDTMNIPKKALEDKYPFLKFIDWLFPWHDNRVILFSNIAVNATLEGLNPYLADLLVGRLMLWPEGGGKVSLIITPEFISYYNGQFPNSIWIDISCKGAFNDTLAAVFLAKGGGAWYGYSDYVKASYAHYTERNILEQLINNGKNAGEAFEAAVAAHGANDGDSDPAALTLHGEKKTKIGKSDLKNQSFEDPNGAGSLNGWTTEGDGRVIKVLGSDGPTNGGTMAIISTGLGFTTTSGSIYQNFCLSAKAKSLVFDWNFYSEEFKEWCNTQFDDTFQVSVKDIQSGAEVVLFKTSVNILCANTDALIKSSISFDKGDAWYTGWKLNETVDISAYQGKAVTLKFFATDKGDSIYDTAILMDNIRIVTE